MRQSWDVLIRPSEGQSFFIVMPLHTEGEEAEPVLPLAFVKLNADRYFIIDG